MRQYFKSQPGAFRKVAWALQNGNGLPPSMTLDDTYTWQYTVTERPNEVSAESWELHQDRLPR